MTEKLGRFLVSQGFLPDEIRLWCAETGRDPCDYEATWLGQAIFAARPRFQDGSFCAFGRVDSPLSLMAPVSAVEWLYLRGAGWDGERANGRMFVQLGERLWFDMVARVPAVVAPPDERTTAQPDVPPIYSEANLVAWLKLRVDTWPETAPFPNFKADREAAERYFHRSIPRDDFRDIREVATPENWRKSGPRGSR